MDQFECCDILKFSMPLLFNKSTKYMFLFLICSGERSDLTDGSDAPLENTDGSKVKPKSGNNHKTEI